jgi:hypothetical protein
MAVGDVVGACSTALGFAFQPAVGVSIALTTVVRYGTSFQVTDGVNVAHITGGQDYSGLNSKLMITNSLWLNFLANASGNSYTGIQIK